MAERYIIDTGAPARDGLYVNPGSLLKQSLWDQVRNDKAIAYTIEPMIQNAPGQTPVLLPDFLVTDLFQVAMGKADQPPSSGTWTLTVGGSSAGMSGLAFNALAVAFAATLSARMVTLGYSACVVVDLVASGGTFSVKATAVGAVPSGVIVGDSTLLVPTCDEIISEISLGSGSTEYEYLIALRQSPVMLSNPTTLIAAASVAAAVTQAQDATHFAINTISFSDPDPLSGSFSLSVYCLGLTKACGQVAWDASAATLATALNINDNAVGRFTVTKANSAFVIGFINEAGPKPITGSSIANPTVITAPKHGYTTGMTVTHSGTDSTPNTDGNRVVTRIDDDTYSVPVNVTGAGTTGVTRDSTPPSVTVTNVNLVGPQGVTGLMNLNSVNLYKLSLLEDGETFSDLFYTVVRIRVSGERKTIYGPIPVNISKDIVDVLSLAQVVFPGYTAQQILNYFVNSGTSLGITTVAGVTAAGLAGQPTAGLNSIGRMVWVDDATYGLKCWKLYASTFASAPADGTQRPTDYDGATNAVCWFNIS